jgi:succinate dehydrogenase / fumarate reductase, cytochrome b subunit
MTLLKAFQSSIGRKLVMGLTGFFLVTFLIVHVGINSMIFFNDGGATFNQYATFMSHNYIIRVMEIGLFVGFIVHIVQGFSLTLKNQKARPIKYEVAPGNNTSNWYSRSMGILGSLLLIFLVVHLSNFWLGTKASLYLHNDAPHDTFSEMKGAFSNWILVAVYVSGVIALWWHLIHGIPSAFQTLGINNSKYNKLIKNFGYAFATLVCLLFAGMPIALATGLIQ